MRKDRGIDGYMEAMATSPSRPVSAVELSFRVLEQEPGEVKDFSSIFDKQGMLAIIKDDRFVRLYQKELSCLISLYGLSQIDTRLKPLFLSKRAQLFAELGLTRAKEGEERKHQAAFAGYRPTQDLQGYGTSDPEQPNPNQIDQARKFIRGLRRG